MILINVPVELIIVTVLQISYEMKIFDFWNLVHQEVFIILIAMSSKVLEIFFCVKR